MIKLSVKWLLFYHFQCNLVLSVLKFELFNASQDCQTKCESKCLTVITLPPLLLLAVQNVRDLCNLLAVLFTKIERPPEYLRVPLKNPPHRTEWKPQTSFQEGCAIILAGQSKASLCLIPPLGDHSSEQATNQIWLAFASIRLFFPYIEHISFFVTIKIINSMILNDS